jgi:hypothetical protein
VILHEWVTRGAHASFSCVVAFGRLGEQLCTLWGTGLAEGAPTHGGVRDTLIGIIATPEVLHVGESCSTHASRSCIVALGEIGCRKAVQAPFVSGSVRLLHAPLLAFVTAFCELDQRLARLSSAALAILGALELLAADGVSAWG